MILDCESGNENLPAHMDGSIQNPWIWTRLVQNNVYPFTFGEIFNKILTNIEHHPVAGDYDDYRILCDIICVLIKLHTLLLSLVLDHLTTTFILLTTLIIVQK